MNEWTYRRSSLHPARFLFVPESFASLIFLAFIIILTLPGMASAQSGKLQFDLPIGCTIGTDCFVQNYVDMRPDTEYRDYRCGPLSYDGHTGTDFRVLSFRQMEAGVPVLAAADGIVVTARDGMPDVNYQLVGREAVTKKGLGNAVVIRHRDGYVTYYGHMKRGSIRVHPGEAVSDGTVIGMLGLSGLTEFPHVHFEVRKDGKVIDPFSGRRMGDRCGMDGNEPLWTRAASGALSYVATRGLHLGFSESEMNRAAIEYELFSDETLTYRIKDLWFNAFVTGLYPNDRIRMLIIGPDGTPLANDQSIFDHMAAVQQFQASIHREDGNLPTGEYVGRILIERRLKDGSYEPVLDERRTITLR